ncbi:hypothetical protein [Streptomyces sp. NBC_00094]|uniref:DUF6892 domain-containing protein n=1 Tax=Streptomyces sp. NBC_00094 TaxID=2903620 RepID=UPI00225257FF|nr:hypothetical protein [Streptomyces sp. NBC_00094]MCX5395076.1 hypothetical protein [Streptomyces sp. NBC_00094]
MARTAYGTSAPAREAPVAVRAAVRRARGAGDHRGIGPSSCTRSRAGHLLRGPPGSHRRRGGRPGPPPASARVEELCFDAGADVFRHCAPAWDGEDDLFDVRSLDDLALLPNLREVTFVEDGVLAVPDAAEAFAARGIDTD